MARKLKDIDAEILIAFVCNNMSIEDTAKSQFIHRNTVTYHLEKVEAVTGLNPRNFFDLVQLMELIGAFSIQCKFFKKPDDSGVVILKKVVGELDV